VVDGNIYNISKVASHCLLLKKLGEKKLCMPSLVELSTFVRFFLIYNNVTLLRSVYTYNKKKETTRKRKKCGQGK